MRVTPPDLELWLTKTISALAAAEGVEVDVDNKEPADLGLPMARPLIVVRDDSGAKIERPTFDRSVGFSVLGGSKRAPKPMNDLARWLAAVVFDDHELVAPADSPIAAVVIDGCNGPYAVAEELDVCRLYMTAQYVAVGSW